jgi:hypothetical protein
VRPLGCEAPRWLTARPAESKHPIAKINHFQEQQSKDCKDSLNDTLKEGDQMNSLLTTFTPYLGLAVILYAIRQTNRVSNRYIPVVAVVLGILYSFWVAGDATPGALLDGLQYALYGIGTVASVKYFINNNGINSNGKN